MKDKYWKNIGVDVCCSDETRRGETMIMMRRASWRVRSPARSFAWYADPRWPPEIWRQNNFIPSPHRLINWLIRSFDLRIQDGRQKFWRQNNFIPFPLRIVLSLSCWAFARFLSSQTIADKQICKYRSPTPHSLTHSFCFVIISSTWSSSSSSWVEIPAFFNYRSLLILELRAPPNKTKIYSSFHRFSQFFFSFHSFFLSPSPNASKQGNQALAEFIFVYYTEYNIWDESSRGEARRGKGRMRRNEKICSSSALCWLE